MTDYVVRSNNIIMLTTWPLNMDIHFYICMHACRFNLVASAKSTSL